MVSGILKKGISLAAIILCISFVFPSFAAVTSEKLEQQQEELAGVKEQKDTLEKGLKDIQETVKELENLKDNVEDYVVNLDGKLNELSAQMTELTDALKGKEEAIRKTEQALSEAQALVDSQYESMKTRIKFMYEKGNTAYLEMLFSAESFADMLNKAGYINELSKYDRNMLLEYQETQAEIENLKGELQQEKEELVEIQEGVKANQQSVQTLMDAKTEELNSFENQITSKEELMKEYEEEIAAQDNEIKALESAVAAEKKRLEEEAENTGEEVRTQNYDGGQFVWPCPSYTRISSDYGYRIHPTLGVEKFHNGVDMAASAGSAILAAYGGTVVSASYNSTMGNYVMIDHGDGLFTIYMHASQLLVSAGQKVEAGAQIALVGSTGRSTGPHLHFSVRLNGSYVSPWNYL